MALTIPAGENPWGSSDKSEMMMSNGQVDIGVWNLEEKSQLEA